MIIVIAISTFLVGTALGLMIGNCLYMKIARGWEENCRAWQKVAKQSREEVAPSKSTAEANAEKLEACVRKFEEAMRVLPPNSLRYIADYLDEHDVQTGQKDHSAQDELRRVADILNKAEMLIPGTHL